MKILSRNLGLYYRYRYAHLRNASINKHPIQLQHFNHWNTHYIKQILQNLNPDIAVFQELTDINDCNILQRDDNHSYTDSTPTHHSTEHQKWIMSIFPITEKKEQTINGEVLTAFSIQDYAIIPVHLNAFSATKRLQQVHNLITFSQSLDLPVILLGDFNLRSHKKTFLWQKDRQSYNLLCTHFTDLSQNSWPTTVVYVKLDYIFSTQLSHPHQLHITKQTGTHMDHYPLLLNIETTLSSWM